MVVEAADGGGLGEAAVADEGTEVASGEGVGRVDEAVAGEAEAGGVGLTVDKGPLGPAELAQRFHGRGPTVVRRNAGRPGTWERGWRARFSRGKRGRAHAGLVEEGESREGAIALGKEMEGGGGVGVVGCQRRVAASRAIAARAGAWTNSPGCLCWAPFSHAPEEPAVICCRERE